MNDYDHNLILIITEMSMAVIHEGGNAKPVFLYMNMRYLCVSQRTWEKVRDSHETFEESIGPCD